MNKKVGRKKLNEKSIIENPTYRNILNLISTSENVKNKQIERKHLRVALCKDHGLDISDREEKQIRDFFVFIDEKIFQEMLDKGLISREHYEKILKSAKKNWVHRMREAGWLNDDIMFKNSNVLNYALDRLKNEFKLIDVKRDKKGKKYYVLTKKGNIEYTKYHIKNYIIDKLPNNEVLLIEIEKMIRQFLLLNYKINIC